MRSESDKLSMAPIKVKFGETAYEIKLLRTMAQREWRTKLTQELDPVLKNLQITTSDAKVLSSGLVSALAQFPEKLADLLFAYDQNLPKEKILEESTEEQIAAAFAEVMQVAYPFLGQLGMVTAMLRSEAVPSPKPASSRLQ
jgi:hypothetical protein